MKLSSYGLSVRMRQSLLTAALALPLIIAMIAAPPFSATPRAQGPSHMLGPVFPITAGSDNIVPIRSGNTISYPSRFACGDSVSNVLTLSNPDGSGRFRTMARELGSLHQTLTITAFSGSAPQRLVLDETRDGVLAHSTTMTLVDLNSDGVVDAASFAGQYNATISLVFSGDNVSIPWSQASTLGIDTNYSCAGALPQVWIPLADTNGDGRGDSIVLDLDGNGVADTDLYSGPVVSPPSVPAMGPIARLILLMLVTLIGAWFVSRRPGNLVGASA